jgi:hypothetical protein
MSGLKGCITSAKFTMKATVLRQNFASADSPVDIGAYYDVYQDPISGDISRKWTATDPDVPSATEEEILCMVEGIVDGGIRVAGTTERFTNIYENVDWARMTFSKNVLLSKRDRITNIRSVATGEVLWKEEETATYNPSTKVYTAVPTTFEILGVTPITNPFGNVTEYIALLQRAEIQ